MLGIWNWRAMSCFIQNSYLKSAIAGSLAIKKISSSYEGEGGLKDGGARRWMDFLQ